MATARGAILDRRQQGICAVGAYTCRSFDGDGTKDDVLRTRCIYETAAQREAQHFIVKVNRQFYAKSFCLLIVSWN